MPDTWQKLHGWAHATHFCMYNCGFTAIVGKPSATGLPTGPTQPFILSALNKLLVSWNRICTTVYRWCHLVKATEVTAGLARSSGWLPVHRDQLRAPWLSNESYRDQLRAPWLSNESYRDQLRAPWLSNEDGKLYLFYKLYWLNFLCICCIFVANLLV